MRKLLYNLGLSVNSTGEGTVVSPLIGHVIELSLNYINRPKDYNNHLNILSY